MSASAIRWRGGRTATLPLYMTMALRIPHPCLPQALAGLWPALFLRQSCHDCQYTNLNRPGDFTLGDLWGLRPDEFPGAAARGRQPAAGEHAPRQLPLRPTQAELPALPGGAGRGGKSPAGAAHRPGGGPASFFASYAVEPFEEVRRQFFRLPSLPVRAAGKLLSPEAKAKLKAKLHR